MCVHVQVTSLHGSCRRSLASTQLPLLSHLRPHTHTSIKHFYRGATRHLGLSGSLFVLFCTSRCSLLLSTNPLIFRQCLRESHDNCQKMSGSHFTSKSKGGRKKKLNLFFFFQIIFVYIFRFIIICIICFTLKRYTIIKDNFIYYYNIRVILNK